MNRERCEGWGLAGAAAVVAGVFAYSHGPIIWKLAQETLFYADFAGLRELLGPCSAPGGLLDWLARGVHVTGLGGVWWRSPRAAFPKRAAGRRFSFRRATSPLSRT